MRTRLLVATAVIAALSLLGVSPAMASVPTPYAIDDVDNVPYPRGDITSVRLHVAPAKVVWTLTLRRGVDLTAAPWGVLSDSAILIPMDTEGGGAIDFRIGISGSLSGADGEVEDLRAGGDDACPAPTIDQPGNLRTIRIRVSRACLGNPPEVRGRVTYAFDAGTDGDVDSVDLAPDQGFTPQVVGPPPSAG